MPSVTVTLTGADRVFRKLDRLSDALRGRALADAVMAGTEPIKAEAKAVVRVKTGNLRASIDSELTESTGRVAAAAVGFGSQAPYGRFLELGTSRMPAYPFLRPGMEAGKGMAVRVMRDSLERSVQGSVR